MTVYVDSARHPFGRMLMCHMIADTLDELHGMADAIGVDRKWFQSNASFPHYDICQSKRQLAIAAGAVVVDNRALAHKMRELRQGDPQVAML